MVFRKNSPSRLGKDGRPTVRRRMTVGASALGLAALFSTVGLASAEAAVSSPAAQTASTASASCANGGVLTASVTLFRTAGGWTPKGSVARGTFVFFGGQSQGRTYVWNSYGVSGYVPSAYLKMTYQPTCW